MGRRRRTDHLRGGSGGAQRVLQGHGQAYPLVPAEEPRHLHGVTFKLAAALVAAAFINENSTWMRRGSSSPLRPFWHRSVSRSRRTPRPALLRVPAATRRPL